MGFDLWQVKSGTIFDNVLVTDDVEYAKAALSGLKEKQEGEKKAKEALDKVERDAAAADEKKDDGGDDEDEDDEDADDEEHVPQVEVIWSDDMFELDVISFFSGAGTWRTVECSEKTFFTW